ncbi:hypothetical protein SDC9_203839 [bioreactor metagenome]|uniref:Uncharacterized protein n=1 Tax=bioreactor metagenome TaxID=1076179 RepID=A0A645J9G7_9ZZZZ
MFSTSVSPRKPSGRPCILSGSAPCFARRTGRFSSPSIASSPSAPPPKPPRARPSGCTTTTCGWCRRRCANCGRTSGSLSSITPISRRPTPSTSCPGAGRSSVACCSATTSASTFPARRRISSMSPPVSLRCGCSNGAPARRVT